MYSETSPLIVLSLDCANYRNRDEKRSDMTCIIREVTAVIPARLPAQQLFPVDKVKNVSKAYFLEAKRRTYAY